MTDGMGSHGCDVFRWYVRSRRFETSEIENIVHQLRIVLPVRCHGAVARGLLLAPRVRVATHLGTQYVHSSTSSDCGSPVGRVAAQYVLKWTTPDLDRYSMKQLCLCRPQLFLILPT